MPRPQKEGIDYFSLDVNFFVDKKIKILKARFGADGITIYLYLLCEIYRCGYYIRFDEDLLFITSDDLGMSPDKVKQVLNFLLERSLFYNILFQSDKVLTSAGIQRRFQLAVKERARKKAIEIKGFWLLTEQETEPFIKVNYINDKSVKNEDKSRKNDIKSQEVSIKESKVKKSKVKESKVKDTSTGITFVPDESLNYAVLEYMEYRKGIRKPMTERAVSLMLEKLDKMAADSAEKIEILNQSVINGWQGIFPLRSQTGKTTQALPVKQGNKNQFHNFEQRNTDYDALAKEKLMKMLGEGK